MSYCNSQSIVISVSQSWTFLQWKFEVTLDVEEYSYSWYNLANLIVFEVSINNWFFCKCEYILLFG